MLTSLSLCAGVGGIDLGLEAHGYAPLTFAEYEPHASAVLAHRWPDVPNLHDLTTADWTPYADRVDVLTAGFPCQPFSMIGARNGINDPRHIFPRIADAIRVVRPRLVLLENVRGHLTLGFDTVLGTLADLGFNAEWGLFRASDVGAPHRRERLFILAYSDDIERERWEDDGTHRGDGSSDGRETFADAAGARRQGTTESQGRHHGIPCALRPDIFGRYADAVHRWERVRGIPAPLPSDDRGRLNPAFSEWMMGFPPGWVTDLPMSRAAQFRCIGNAVVPAVATNAFSTLLARVNTQATAA